MNAKLVQLSALQCLHLIVPLTLIVLLTLLRLLPSRGPSVAAEPADKTRRAPHMDVRRFPRGQDAPSENPAGSANPMRSRTEEHTSEIQQLTRISDAVFCLKKQ